MKSLKFKEIIEYMNYVNVIHIVIKNKRKISIYFAFLS